MGFVPGPDSGEGEAAGPPSRDSARVYLDAFTGPLPVYRTRPGAAPLPPSSGLVAQAAAEPLPSPPGWERGGVVCRGSVSPAAPRAAAVRSCPFAILPPLRPDTGAPGLGRFFISFGVNRHDLPTAFPLLLRHHHGFSSSPSHRPGGAPGEGSSEHPRAARSGVCAGRGCQGAEGAARPPATGSSSAAGAQTLDGKDCKTAKEGKQSGWSVSGCSGEPRSAAGSSPAGAVPGGVM